MAPGPGEARVLVPSAAVGLRRQEGHGQRARQEVGRCPEGHYKRRNCKDKLPPSQRLAGAAQLGRIQDRTSAALVILDQNWFGFDQFGRLRPIKCSNKSRLVSTKLGLCSTKVGLGKLRPMLGRFVHIWAGLANFGAGFDTLWAGSAILEPISSSVFLRTCGDLRSKLRPAWSTLFKAGVELMGHLGLPTYLPRSQPID